MHEYSIDVEHNKVYFGLAFISILISVFVSFILNILIETIPYIELILSVTAIGVFGILYSLFDKYVWKWKCLQSTGIVRTPNLNGTWQGEFKSSFHNFEQGFPAVLTIEQTWSKICIKGKFNHSKSSSYTTSIKINDGGDIKLIYSYYNDKNPQHYKEGMSNHRGYGSVEINHNLMEGYYFNDPTNNSNHGTLKLWKCPSTTDVTITPK